MLRRCVMSGLASVSVLVLSLQGVLAADATSVSANKKAKIIAAKSVPQETISVAPNAVWSGSYLGLSASYNLANLEFSLGNLVDLNGFGARGYGGGVLAGYNFAIGDRQIVGVEAAVDYSDDRISIGLSQYGYGSATAYARTDWSGELALRYGYLLTPNAMLFGSVGVTVTHARADYSMVVGGDTVASANAQDIFYGLAFGGIGMEARLGHGWHARLDYNENFLQAKVYDWGGSPLMAKPTIGTGKVAVVYSFDDHSGVTKTSFDPKWTGLYGGGSVGIDHGVSRYDLPIVDGYNFYLDGFGSTGISGQVLLGYNLKLASQFIVGVEANGKGTTSESNYLIDPQSSPTGLRGRDTLSYGLRARAGYLFSPETLGYAYAGASRNLSSIQLVEGGFEIPGASEKYNRQSIDFGGGMETFMSESTSVRVEYGVSQFEAADLIKEIPTAGTLTKFGSEGRIALITHF